MTRAEGAARAAELKAQGLNGLQIAKRMGIGKSQAYELLTDPDGSRRRKQRERYTGLCIDCGKRTNAGQLPPPERCGPCLDDQRNAEYERWVVASMHKWADLFGAPPSAMDWNQHDCIAKGAQRRVDRYVATGRKWPSVRHVQERFGTWNAAVAAAGFTPMAGGHKRSELRAA